MALTTICLHMSYVFTILKKEKSAENVVQAYMSGILPHKGGSVAILSNNGTEFKNKVLNKVHDQLDIKRLFSNQFHPQGNVNVENVHNCPKRNPYQIYGHKWSWMGWTPSIWLLLL